MTQMGEEGDQGLLKSPVEVAREHEDYNVAVCLTTLKIAQICYWITGNSKSFTLNENHSLPLPLPGSDGFECGGPE